MWEVNVGGDAECGGGLPEGATGRLIYTSSVHAIADPPKGGRMTESDVFDPARVRGIYAKSKAAATACVLNAAGEGLDAVVVHPSGVIGPYENKLSNLGQLIVNFSKRKLPAYVNGGYNFVDVRDVAAGCIAAAEHGTKGECYILSGESMSVKELMECLNETTGVPAPKWKMPCFLAMLAAPFAELGYRIRKTQPLFTSYSIATLATNPEISHEKPRGSWATSRGGSRSRFGTPLSGSSRPAGSDRPRISPHPQERKIYFLRGRTVRTARPHFAPSVLACASS